MSLQFYEPFFSFNDFHRLVNDALSDRPTTNDSSRSGNNQRTSALTAFQPRMDIHESPESNLVTATIELPGLQKENVQIDVQGNRLIISGEKTSENNVDEKGYVLRERSTGRFHRALPLPAGTQVSILFSASPF